MAITGLSEFTFGFAFLYEQTRQNWKGLRAAPILPSLRQEANDAWDAKLPTRGVDYYYQFKLSDYMHRSNAKYIQDGTYTDPYYRFSLHRRENNRQHQRLRRHSGVHPRTYYVAPEFQLIEDFNTSFLAQEITARSRLIPVAKCKNFRDSKQHHITYQDGKPGWTEHSEPTFHENSIPGKNLETLYRSSTNQWKTLDFKFAEALFEDTAKRIEKQVRDESKGAKKEMVLPLLDIGASERTRVGFLRKTADVLAVTVGVTLVLVGENEQELEEQ